MFVAGRPGGDLGRLVDFPASHDALADTAMLADGWQIGEKIADPVGIAHSAPCEIGRWDGHDGHDTTLVAPLVVGNGLAAYDRGGC